MWIHQCTENKHYCCIWNANAESSSVLMWHLQAEQTYTDCGPIVVGTSTTVHINLMNEGDCSLHYRLLVEQSVSGPTAEEGGRVDPYSWVIVSHFSWDLSWTTLSFIGLVLILTESHFITTAFELDCMHGVLPARSRKVIEAVVRPTRRVYYQWAISYVLITPEGTVSTSVSSSPL